MRQDHFRGMGIARRAEGLVRLELCGPQPEAVLNACALEDLEVAGAESVDAYTIRLTINAGELSRFRQLAQRCRCEATVLAEQGGKRIWRLVKRRMALAFLAAAVGLTLLLSSLFVWEIDVVGAESLSRGRILRTLDECGLKSGCFWPGLETDTMRSQLLTRMPELAWAAVNVSGSRATVLLLERTEAPEIDREEDSADLIASHSGVVSELSVLRGRPLVSPGSAVLPGEMLVSGTVGTLNGTVRRLGARGAVMADTWYERIALCPQIVGKAERSGSPRNRFAIELGGRRINFYRNSGKAIDGYDKIVHESMLGVKGLFALPIRFVREEYVRFVQESGTEPDSVTVQHRLYDALAAEIDGEIRSATYTVSEENGLMTVTMRAHCRENIARREKNDQT